MPALGQHRFGVKLHAPQGKFGVLDAHDDPVVGAGGDDKLPDRVRLGRQRMVPSDRKRRGKPLEEPSAVVADDGRLPVHQSRRMRDDPAEDFGQRLMPEAHAQHGGLGLRTLLDGGDGRPGLGRGSRAGRGKHAVVGGDGSQIHDVVADHRGARAQQAEIVDERVDEAVVVVDDQKLRHQPTVLSKAGKVSATQG